MTVLVWYAMLPPSKSTLHVLGISYPLLFRRHKTSIPPEVHEY